MNDNVKANLERILTVVLLSPHHVLHGFSTPAALLPRRWRSGKLPAMTMSCLYIPAFQACHPHDSPASKSTFRGYDRNLTSRRVRIDQHITWIPRSAMVVLLGISCTYRQAWDDFAPRHSIRHLSLVVLIHDLSSIYDNPVRHLSIYILALGHYEHLLPNVFFDLSPCRRQWKRHQLRAAFGPCLGLSISQEIRTSAQPPHNKRIRFIRFGRVIASYSVRRPW